MKVLLLARYGSLGASSRVRFLQYLPYFEEQGANITIKPLFSNTYLRALYRGSSRWKEVLRGYLARIGALLGAWQYDIIIIEKELFPFMPAVAERALRWLGVRYVVDYDDALFHRYDCHPNRWVRRLLGNKIDYVMKSSACVIAGNNYLAERARKAGAGNVEIIPTVVDAYRYQPLPSLKADTPIVGWIGTPQTSHYLRSLIPTMTSIKKEFAVRFVAVGANPSEFEQTPVEVWPWSEPSEVDSIKQFSIGIMPLPDSPWERGKCGYKLIQYMACGIPVIASSVGVNPEIVEPDGNGLLVNSTAEWEEALRKLLMKEPEELGRMGRQGRLRVEGIYSTDAQAPRLWGVIERAANS